MMKNLWSSISKSVERLAGGAAAAATTTATTTAGSSASKTSAVMTRTKDVLTLRKDTDLGVLLFTQATKTPFIAGESLQYGALTHPAAVIEQLIVNHQPLHPLLGDGAVEKALCHQWVTYTYETIVPAGGDPGLQKAYSKFLNEHLVDKTFMVAEKLTWADFVVYAHTRAYVTKMTEKRRSDINHFVRWFDLVQHQALARASGVLPEVAINLDVAEEQQPAAAAAKDSAAPADKKAADKKQKQQKPAANGAATAATATGDAPKREKKEKVKKPQPAAPAELPAWNPARLDIRVGKIVECRQHENADSLYVEQIDLGEEKPRTVVSGLVKHIPLDKMQQRMVVVLCNLKPATMRGIKSEGMVLAATGADGKVELLNPPAGAKPGDHAWFDGFPNDEHAQPDAQLNPKKKIWETIQPGLFTDGKRVANYKLTPQEAHPEVKEERVCMLKTEAGVVTVDSVLNATIK